MVKTYLELTTGIKQTTNQTTNRPPTVAELGVVQLAMPTFSTIENNKVNIPTPQQVVTNITRSRNRNRRSSREQTYTELAPTQTTQQEQMQTPIREFENQTQPTGQTSNFAQQQLREQVTGQQNNKVLQGSLEPALTPAQKAQQSFSNFKTGLTSGLLPSQQTSQNLRSSDPFLSTGTLVGSVGGIVAASVGVTKFPKFIASIGTGFIAPKLGEDIALIGTDKQSKNLIKSDEGKLLFRYGFEQSRLDLKNEANTAFNAQPRIKVFTTPKITGRLEPAVLTTSERIKTGLFTTKEKILSSVPKTIIGVVKTVRPFAESISILAGKKDSFVEGIKYGAKEQNITLSSQDITAVSYTHLTLPTKRIV